MLLPREPYEITHGIKFFALVVAIVLILSIMCFS